MHAAHALNLLQQGRTDEAQALCERACRENPGDAQAWFFLAGIHAQHGRLPAVVDCCRKVLELQPGNTAALYNLGVALQNLGRNNEAADVYQQLLALQPDTPPAYANLALALRAVGQLGPAEQAARQAVRLAPQSAEAHNNLGLVLKDLGRIDAAIAAFQQALNLKPALAQAHYNLGLCLGALQRHSEALEAYRKAAQGDAQNPDIPLAMAAAYLGISDQSRARGAYEAALALRADHLPARIGLASLLATLGDYAAAETHYRQILEHHPGHAEAVIGMAMLREYQGEFSAASAWLQPLLEQETPSLAAALCHANIAPRIGRTADAADLLERLLATASTDAQRIDAHFALGKLLDKLHRYDEAFEHIRAANALKAGEFDPQQNRAYFDAVIDTFSAERMERLPRATLRSDLPVFIVGMPRSGTSLVEQILASHPDVAGAGELDDISRLAGALPRLIGTDMPYPRGVSAVTQTHLDRFAADYLARLRSISADARRITDKMPHNFLALGLIEMLFPDARVIHCIRDPLDTCLSIHFQNFTSNHPYTRDLGHLGRYYREYERLMTHWRSVLKLPLLDIHYEDLVADQESGTRRLLEFCGLDWNDACLRFNENTRAVTTPSYDQVRQPLYDSSVGRWRHYERHLAPLRAALQESIP